MLLLTGATGEVGSALLPRLAGQDHRRVIALVRDPRRIPDGHGVDVVRGDITRPALGLRGDVLRRVRASVTEIVHCAADTSFSKSIQSSRATNVGGTARVLDLARACPHLQKLVHVSTTYVAGRLSGSISETRLPSDAGFQNVYQQTKHEAEALVFDAMDTLPVSIHRLSTIFGEAATGRFRRLNYTHQLLRLLPRGVLPMVPADPDAPVDLISTEWAVAVLAHLFERFEPGCVRHVCAGPKASMSVAEIREQAVRAFAEHSSGLPPFDMPELATVARWEAWTEEVMRGRDVLLQRVVEALDRFLPLFAVPQAFDDTQTQADIADAGLVLPPIRDTFRRVVRYCLDTDWGRHQPASLHAEA